MASQKIGKVTHYYDKIAVAVIKLTKGDLKVGDKVKLVNKEGKEFTQVVESMQVEHATIDIAKTGDEFGLKVDQPPKTLSEIYKGQ